MTREEEIIKASYRYAKHQQKPFVDGAKWADKTMLDRVCKVIEEMLPNYVELNCVFDEISVNYNKFKNNFISDLRKAMEE